MPLNLPYPQLRGFSSKFDKLELYWGRPIPAHKRRLIPTSGSYPKRFDVGSTRAGVKPVGNIQPDLVIVASNTPPPALGAQSSLRMNSCAASVTVSRKLIRRTNGAGLR
ncbi:hypothetical protein PENARI_c003G06509 [Penicillium arizonense]|uniref:Uncharacterized protein n=1 Tax=Penicillium arizonense TaxID=1835702 RepID=A0A1F5LT82_PENAI|nr:hypothetical protein PENARI_c003G06509 [Penicillium arizonense]OGE56423.1 hypothetical protein PENARI_c003G06509 [Penicillium arizonense]